MTGLIWGVVERIDWIDLGVWLSGLPGLILGVGERIDWIDLGCG